MLHASANDEQAHCSKIANKNADEAMWMVHDWETIAREHPAKIRNKDEGWLPEQRVAVRAEPHCVHMSRTFRQLKQHSTCVLFVECVASCRAACIQALSVIFEEAGVAWLAG